LRTADCGLNGRPSGLGGQSTVQKDGGMPGAHQKDEEAEAFRQRTRGLVLRVVRLVEALPRSAAARLIGGQLLRSGTSIGANCRAACRARTRAEFMAKMGIVEEEADETVYWIELLVDAGLVAPSRVADLMDEANQVVTMVVSPIKTARGNR
jgi:four helix bundle protein